MRNTLDYNSPNRDSSPKQVLSSSPVGSEKLSHGNTTIIFNNPPPSSSQTLDQHNQYNLSYPLNRPNKPRTKDHHHHPEEPSPDPIATVSPSSTNPSGSNLKTPVNTATAVAASPIRYRECLKNHAASSGRHVLDGCGEFMPSGEEGSAEAMICAACECHRNFHRKEIDGESQYVPNYKDSSRRNSLVLPPQQYHLPPPPPPPPPRPHHHHHHHHHGQFALHGLSATPATGGGPIPPVMMAFGSGGVAAESSSEDLHVFQSTYSGGRPQQSAPASSKKRFRTKFNQQQKDKMMEFAEKLGWRIQKHDEQEVQQFCSQVGVKRPVFKVWMHNNKQAMKKKQM